MESEQLRGKYQSIPILHVEAEFINVNLIAIQQTSNIMDPPILDYVDIID